jgi:hypothetical protein
MSEIAQVMNLFSNTCIYILNPQIKTTPKSHTNTTINYDYYKLQIGLYPVAVCYNTRKDNIVPHNTIKQHTSHRIAHITKNNTQHPRKPSTRIIWLIPKYVKLVTSGITWSSRE